MRTRKLIVMFPEGETVIPLRGERYRIGRGGDNEIVLEEPTVSRYHAVLELSGEGAVLRDQGSSYGTWIEGLRQSSWVLKGGERVRFGKRLEAMYLVNGEDVEAGPEDREEERIGERGAWIEGADGEVAGRRFDLNTDKVLIGRDPSCDILLASQRVSRKHAEISREGDSCWIHDLHSANGVFINGERKEVHRLGPGDEIRIDICRFKFGCAGGGVPLSTGPSDQAAEGSSEREFEKAAFPAPDQTGGRDQPIENESRAGADILLRPASEEPESGQPESEEPPAPEVILGDIGIEREETPDFFERETRPLLTRPLKILLAVLVANLVLISAITIYYIFFRSNPPEEENPRQENVREEVLRHEQDMLFASEEELMQYVISQFEEIMSKYGLDTENIPPAFSERVWFSVNRFLRKERGFFGRSLARSEAYLPMISRILVEMYLPEEFAYIPLVESGFDPQAISPAGAAGMWQLMPGTAREYRLRVDPEKGIDERLDPVKSTKAATAYLKNLFMDFGAGSPLLVMAAYNAGENKIRRALRKGKNPFGQERSFWFLSDRQYLPEETNDYVPRVLAAILIAKRPALFGFGEAG